MKYNTFVNTKEDIQECLKVKEINEVLIEPEFCAREGRLSIEEAQNLAIEATKNNLRAVLVWDALMTDSSFNRISEEFTKVNVELFSAVRFQCVGAGEWLREKYPNIKLQFIAETGNNNLKALSSWADYFKGSLEKVILSIQLPEEKIIEYIEKLNVECEVLGVGRILLFYSPRSLLAPNFDSQEEDTTWIEVDSASEDSHMRPFPTLESIHGTFMYLDKDQFILNKLSGIEEAGIASVRIDLRHLSSNKRACENISRVCSQIIEGEDSQRRAWPRPTLAPFFKSNKTTKQFSRLRTKTRIFRDENCLAEVVSTDKPKILALFTLQEFTTDVKTAFILPSGEKITPEVEWFKDNTGSIVNHCAKNTLVTSSWCKKIVPGTLLVKE